MVAVRVNDTFVVPTPGVEVPVRTFCTGTVLTVLNVAAVGMKSR